MSEKAARDQTILVYLLLMLHPLFGITGLIGAIISHTRKDVTADTVFASHNTWQIWTFWTGAIGYAAGFYYWWRMGTVTILVLTLFWILYRVGRGWWFANQHRSIGPGAYP